MRCIAPIPIQSRHRVYTTDVPCGRCYACLANRRNQWTFRLLNELKVAESNYFVTLTYDQDHIPTTRLYNRFDIPTLDKTDVQKFKKRLRGEILQNEDPDGPYIKKSEKSGNYSPKLRYFTCGEYGSQGNRPHYHTLLYNLPKSYVRTNPINQKLYSPILEEVWGKGMVDIGKIQRESAHYVSQYTLGHLIEEKWKNDPRKKPFALMSRKPGIGLSYVDENIKDYYHNTKDSYATGENGVKNSLGRYYKEKIFENDQIKREVQRRAAAFAKAREDYQRKHSKNYEAEQREAHRRAVNKIKRKAKKGKL